MTLEAGEQVREILKAWGFVLRGGASPHFLLGYGLSGLD